MNTKTAGARNTGDNIIDRDTSGAASGGITNEPAFPNNNAVNPLSQGGSHDWTGVVPGAAPSDGGVDQYAEVAGDADRNLSGSGEVEQAYAKPTDASSPAALGPGMRSR